MLINNVTYQREALTESPIRLPLRVLFEEKILLQVCYINVFDAKKLIFKGFVKFWFFVFVKRQILVKMLRDGAFRYFSQVFICYLLPNMMKDYHYLDLPRKFEHSSLVSLTAVPVFVFYQ